MYSISSVILNYNSAVELKALMPQLLAQQGVRHSIIVVDNASTPAGLKELQNCMNETASEFVEIPPSKIGDSIQPNFSVQSSTRVYLILNNENRGYAAGNNLGARFAENLGADAVLVSNPDMKITDSRYLERLAEALFDDDRNLISASRILGMDSEDQSPLRELGFWEELFWPLAPVRRLLSARPHLLPIRGTEAVAVPKVPGCCLMIRMKFLRQIGYMDEGTFLYSEEPILSAQVAREKGRIIFLPALAALHAHIKSNKAKVAKRMRIFIESRTYYLERYSGYNRLQLKLLRASYAALLFTHRLRER